MTEKRYGDTVKWHTIAAVHSKPVFVVQLLLWLDKKHLMFYVCAHTKIRNITSDYIAPHCKTLLL